MPRVSKDPANTVHYAIWPEGMPQAARFTTSPARAFILQNAMGLAFLFPFQDAKRISTAREIGKRPDPDEYEALRRNLRTEGKANRA